MISYQSKSGDTFRVETRHYHNERWVCYLVWQWDRDWGHCTGGIKEYPFPPDHLWHRAGEYIVDDFGNLVRLKPCFDSGRDITKTDAVWIRDRYTGAYNNIPLKRFT